MYLRLLYAVCFLLASLNLCAQTDSTVSSPGAPDKTRQIIIEPWVDIPLTLALDGYSLYGMGVIYSRPVQPQATILSLDKNNINKLDRRVVDNYSLKAKDMSDYFFYGSMPLPLILMIDKKMRRDGLKLGLLYLQTMGVTGALYTSSAMIADRYRPYAYNPNVPLSTRTRGGVRNSFYAGHVALVGTSLFFMAKTYSDYHPEMRNKWILYTIAAGATVTAGYLRIEAGQHFITDVALGAAMGTLSGILVPHFHKNKNLAGARLSLSPAMINGGAGFSARYTFNP